MNTFSLSFLRSVLVQRDAFIYHGAGVAKGIGDASTNALSYLDRIRNAISDDLEICCSTVRFGDSEVNLDFWGKMGIIVWPKSANSITLVSPQDAGSTPDPNIPGRRNLRRMPITERAICESIDQRPPKTANEWCVLDYHVLGLFVEPPIQFMEDGVLESIDLPQVFHDFVKWPVYGFCHGRLCEINPPGNWGRKVSISELLPTCIGT